MEVTQEQFLQHEEMGGQDADTQEPVVLHPPVKATDEIQVAVAETRADVEIEFWEEVVTQQPTSSQLNVEASKENFKKMMLSHKNQHPQN